MLSIFVAEKLDYILMYQRFFLQEYVSKMNAIRTSELYSASLYYGHSHINCEIVFPSYIS
jgi:hypothetical protein